MRPSSLRNAPAALPAAAGAASLLFAFAAPVPGQSQAPKAAPRISPGRAAAEVAAIAGDVAEARRLVTGVNDRALRDRIDLLLSRAELNARGLRENLAAAATAATPPAAMPPGEFSDFLAALKKNSFDDGKAKFIEDFARGQSFTCAQAVDLLKAFSFDEQRVKAAVALHPRLVDPANFYKVLDVFTFESGKRAVREAVAPR